MTFLGIFRHAPDCRFIRPGNLPERFGKSKGKKETQKMCIRDSGEDKLPLAVVIVLGAIATATAPAATLMVVRQYKAKGKLTDLLLPIVALDDAVGLIVFAVSFGIAKALKSGQVDMVSIIVEPLLEVRCV